MTEIIKLLPILAIAISMNLFGGLYYNIGTKKISFSWNMLISGIIKAIIVAYIFIGMSLCSEAIDLSSVGIDPMFIMVSAIALYFGKAGITLAKILGIEIKTNQFGLVHHNYYNSLLHHLSYRSRLSWRL